MVSVHRKALESMWQDRCDIYSMQKITDPKTKLTDFVEKPLLQDLPCKLSFETLSATNGDDFAIISQNVKIFLSSDVVIPAGCKIVVHRNFDLTREYVYAKSGEPGVFTYHQEISLKPFRGYA